MQTIHAMNIKDADKFFDTCAPPIIRKLKIAIPNKVAISAKEIFVSISENNLMQVRDRIPFVYMTIYTCAQSIGMPIVFSDFKLPRNPKFMMKDFIKSKSIINQYLVSINESSTKRDYRSILQRYSTAVDLDKAQQDYAAQLYAEISKKIPMRRALIPTIIYISSITNIPNSLNCRKTQKYVAKRCNISDYTIRRCRKDIENAYNIRDISAYAFWRSQ